MSRWQQKAACRGKPTAWFFVPPAVNGIPTREHEQAQRLCARCPVARQCATAGRGEEGTWAGEFKVYKEARRGRGGEQRCDRCEGLFERDWLAIDRTCDSCLTLSEYRSRMDRNERRKYPRRPETREALKDLTETFERLVELSVVEFEQAVDW